MAACHFYTFLSVYICRRAWWDTVGVLDQAENEKLGIVSSMHLLERSLDVPGSQARPPHLSGVTYLFYFEGIQQWLIIHRVLLPKRIVQQETTQMHSTDLKTLVKKVPLYCRQKGNYYLLVGLHCWALLRPQLECRTLHCGSGENHKQSQEV